MAKKIVDPKIQARETAEIVEDAFRNVSSEIGKIFAKSLDQTESFAKTLQKDVTGTLNSLAKTSSVIEEVLSKQKSGQLKLADIEKIKEQRLIKLNAIQLQFNIAQKNAIGGSTEQIELAETLNKQIAEAKLAEGELNKELEEFGIQADKNNKKLGVTGVVLKGLNKIPVLGGLINAEKVLAKIQKETAREGSTKFSVFKEGLSGVKSSIMETISDPATGATAAFSILAKVVEFFIDAMFKADVQTTKISKNLSISKDAARGIYDSFILSKSTLDTVYRTTKNMAEAFSDISQITGFNIIATDKQIESQIKLTKQLGQTTEQALGLQEVFALNNVEADKAIHTTYDQIAAFANQNKITADGRQIFSEIAKTSKIIQLNFRGNYKELVNTVLETKKFGLTLEQVSKVGKSLLNFEQSIASEIEAEVVTGKELNLEEARRYALNHDLAGLTKEIAKNIGSAADFSEMNVIQQESIAAAVGMSAEELGDTLYKQELINKLSKGETEEMRKKAAIFRSQNKDKAAFALEERATAIEAGLLRGEALEDAQLQVDAQEKFNLAIERIKELFSDLVNGGLVERLINYLDKFVGSLEAGKSLTDIFISGTASSSEIANVRLKEQQEKLAAEKDEDKKKEIQAKIEELSKEATTSREKEKNVNKVETAAGAVKGYEYGGIIGASVGALYELSKNIISDGTFFAEGGIVNKRVDNATVGEAGPEAIVPLNAFYNKLDELITAVNKGGNVYMDSTKVGTSFAISTREV